MKTKPVAFAAQMIFVIVKDQKRVTDLMGLDYIRQLIGQRALDPKFARSVSAANFTNITLSTRGPYDHETLTTSGQRQWFRRQRVHLLVWLTAVVLRLRPEPDTSHATLWLKGAENSHTWIRRRALSLVEIPVERISWWPLCRPEHIPTRVRLKV